MWADLSGQEAAYTERAIGALESVVWAEPLLAHLDQAGGLITANVPLLFEVRFAYELHRIAATVDYEYRAGVGDSTVDFHVHGERE